MANSNCIIIGSDLDIQFSYFYSYYNSSKFAGEGKSSVIVIKSLAMFVLGAFAYYLLTLFFILFYQKIGL